MVPLKRPWVESYLSMYALKRLVAAGQSEGTAETHSILGLDEGIVDGNDLNVVVLDALNVSVTAAGVLGVRMLTRCGRPEREVSDGARKRWTLKGGLTMRPMRPKPLMPTLVTILMEREECLQHGWKR